MFYISLNSNSVQSFLTLQVGIILKRDARVLHSLLAWHCFFFFIFCFLPFYLQATKDGAVSNTSLTAKMIIGHFKVTGGHKQLGLLNALLGKEKKHIRGNIAPSWLSFFVFRHRRYYDIEYLRSSQKSWDLGQSWGNYNKATECEGFKVLFSGNAITEGAILNWWGRRPAPYPSPA